MKPILFRFAPTSEATKFIGATPWKPIEQLHDPAAWLGYVIEYAYGPPVVTEDMEARALAAYNRSRGTYDDEEPTDAEDIRAALAAALETE